MGVRLNPEERWRYAEEVWAAFQDKIGTERMMSPVEWAVMNGWIQAGIPLRSVLRGFLDCSGKGKTLSYYDPAVQEAERQRQARSTL